MTIRALAALALAAAVLTGCHNNKQSSGPVKDEMAERALGGPKASTADSRTINSMCPIGGHEFNPVNHSEELVREYKGDKIGFCCDGCSTAWDAMGAKQRDEVYALAKANKPGR